MEPGVAPKEEEKKNDLVEPEEDDEDPLDSKITQPIGSIKVETKAK